MTDISMSQAAKLTGKTRATIHKAIQGGRLSAFQDEKKEWRINPAELERVYPMKSTAGGVNVSGDSQESRADTGELMALQREIQLLRDQLQDVKGERDKWQEQAAKISLLLTDQRPAEPRKTLWQRVRGK